MRDKIVINLLPKEFAEAQIEQAKFYRVRLIAVTMLLLMVFLASVTVALRILQNRNLGLARGSLQAAEEKVTQFKQTEVSLAVLADRLKIINQITSIPSKQSAMYNLISGLVPSSVSVDAIAVDNIGNASLSLSSSDSEDLDNFISSLVDSQVNESRVSLVEVNSFSRSREKFYRASIKVVVK